MKSFLPTAAVGLGVVLLVTSLVWGAVFPASAGWSEEKSIQLRELSAKAHVLGGQLEAAKAKPSMHAGQGAAELQAEYDKVTVELKQLGAEAEGKIESPKTAAKILRWSGVAFVIGGALIIFAGRSS